MIGALNAFPAEAAGPALEHLTVHRKHLFNRKSLKPPTAKGPEAAESRMPWPKGRKPRKPNPWEPCSAAHLYI